MKTENSDIIHIKTDITDWSKQTVDFYINYINGTQFCVDHNVNIGTIINSKIEVIVDCCPTYDQNGKFKEAELIPTKYMVSKIKLNEKGLKMHKNNELKLDIVKK